MIIQTNQPKQIRNGILCSFPTVLYSAQDGLDLHAHHSQAMLLEIIFVDSPKPRENSNHPATMHIPFILGLGKAMVVKVLVRCTNPCSTPNPLCSVQFHSILQQVTYGTTKLVHTFKTHIGCLNTAQKILPMHHIHSNSCYAAGVIPNMFMLSSQIKQFIERKEGLLFGLAVHSSMWISQLSIGLWVHRVTHT